MIGRIVGKIKMNRALKAGLQLDPTASLIDTPDFGSEPWLVSIGARVRMSAKVVFITHDGATWVFRSDPRYAKVRRFGRVTIEPDCFVGYGATFLPGVTVGRGSIVGARALVTKDVPPGKIVGGVPAKIIGDVAAFAEKALAETVGWDEAAFAADKRAETLRHHPRPW